MKTFAFTLAALGIALWFAVAATAAVLEDLPSNGITHLDSPDGRYEAALSDGDQPYEYWLTLTDNGHALGRYHFEGELSSGFWSQDGKYLAINNHCGHRSWHVWVIALHTGNIVHAAGLAKAHGYKAYLDYNDLPDIFPLAKSVVQGLTPGVDDYCRRACPVSVAYGWKRGGKLLVFTEAISDTLADKEDSKVFLTSICQVSPKGIKVSHLQGAKVKMDAEYPSGIGDWFP